MATANIYEKFRNQIPYLKTAVERRAEEMHSKMVLSCA